MFFFGILLLSLKEDAGEVIKTDIWRCEAIWSKLIDLLLNDSELLWDGMDFKADLMHGPFFPSSKQTQRLNRTSI